jgi:DNA recombination protein Rad52
MMTPEQTKALSADLNVRNVRQRKQSGREVSYIEGWHAIAEANRIFGFDGWTRETVEIKCVSERERKIGTQQKDGWGVTYIATVRVRVGDVIREGCGAGHGIDVDAGQAHESAIKEAETDAMKRALMTFGNPFGLALYDKAQTHVSDGSEPETHRQDENASLTISNGMVGEIKQLLLANSLDGLKRWYETRKASGAFSELTDADYAAVSDAYKKAKAKLSQTILDAG